MSTPSPPPQQSGSISPGSFRERGTVEEQQVENVRIQDVWQSRTFTWGEGAKVALEAALADSTFKGYNSLATRFSRHCLDRNTTWQQCTEADVATFLDKVSFGLERPENTLNKAVSTIKALFEGADEKAPISDPLFQRIIDGLIRLRTTRPVKHRPKVPVITIVAWIKSLPPMGILPLDTLRLKLLALTAILIIAHPSDLALLRRPKLEDLDADVVSFSMLAYKTDYHRTGWTGQIFRCSDPSLDWIATCKEWLKRTQEWVINNPTPKLFVSLLRPHDSLSADRVSNLLSTVSANAGLDPKVFTGGTYRPGAVAAFLDAKIEPDRIMYCGRWRNEDVWREHYARRGLAPGDAEAIFKVSPPTPSRLKPPASTSTKSRPTSWHARRKK